MSVHFDLILPQANEERSKDRFAKRLAEIEAMPRAQDRAEALGALADAIMPDPEHILTLKDLAQAHGVSEATVRRYGHAGLLRPKISGGVLWFTLRDERRLGEILSCRRLGLSRAEIAKAVGS